MPRRTWQTGTYSGMDTLVFDIETQNFFTDPGVGWDNFEALKISAVGVYSYAKDEYACFEESEIEKLADLFRASRLLVGFSINRYDVPVLNCYFAKLGAPLRLDLLEKDRVDLLEEIEVATGGRISLHKLSEANLGAGKERTGAEAIALWREGKIEELKQYCLRDVELTKQLYDLSRDRGYLFVPNQRTGELVRAHFQGSGSGLTRKRHDAKHTRLF